MGAHVIDEEFRIDLKDNKSVFYSYGRSYEDYENLKGDLLKSFNEAPVDSPKVGPDVPLQVFLKWYEIWEGTDRGSSSKTYELMYANLP